MVYGDDYNVYHGTFIQAFSMYLMQPSALCKSQYFDWIKVTQNMVQ